MDDNVNMFFSPNNNFYYITGQKFAPHIDLGQGEDEYVEYPAKATGNDCFSASPGENDWYETVKLNYGVDPWNGSKHFDPIPDTWHKMLDILLFWASKGVDAFRCDMAHMVPVEFWNWAIGAVKSVYPSVIFIAEIYDVSLYHSYINYGRFDYLYDKVTLYDTLRGIQCGGWPASLLTSCWQTVEGMSANMLNFLENHDEQRYASAQYAGDAMRALPALVVSSTINTGAMMIYMGQELGEKASDHEGYSGNDGRTTIFDYWSIDALRRWLDNGKCNLQKLTKTERNLRKQYSKLLNLVNSSEALQYGKFFDLMYVNYQNQNFDTNKQYAFLRGTENEVLLIVVNFDDKDVDLNVNIPTHAFDYFKIPQGLYNTIDLLSDESSKLMLSDYKPIVLKVRSENAVIVRFNHIQLA
jgi:glycosidase